jgi:hypothetical protein
LESSIFGDTNSTGGVQIDFRADGKGHAFLIAGWSHPEPNYTWTLGKRSLLRLPLNGAGGDLALTFRAGPMTRKGLVDFQRVIIEANGLCLARIVLRAQALHELLVPADALTGRDSVDIVFHLLDAQSPSLLGDSGDKRDLGIWLSSLQLRPLKPNSMPSQSQSAAADLAMLMQVQSLGENCELGFVQREAGAEPLGLLRWGSTPLPMLLAALEARFSGLGHPENVTLEVDGASEFQVLDRRFGFRNHSFAFENAGAKREDILKRETVRLPFLARLLIDDLEKANKLFCFHDAGVSGIERIKLLEAALGSYGENWLLWICRAERPEQVGTAEQIGDRLIRGYIDKFQPINEVGTPSTGAWMGALRSAHRLWQAGRTAGAGG